MALFISLSTGTVGKTLDRLNHEHLEASELQNRLH